MIKRIVLVMSVMALAAGVTVAPGQAGDQRRCVSQREYRHVQVGHVEQPGWRQVRVADHFETRGTRIRYDNVGGVIDSVRKYRKCSPWGPGGRYVGVMYDNYESGTDGYMRAWKKVPKRPCSLTIAGTSCAR